MNAFMLYSFRQGAHQQTVIEIQMRERFAAGKSQHEVSQRKIRIAALG